MGKLVAYKRMPLWTKETIPGCSASTIQSWDLEEYCLEGALKFIELTEDEVGGLAEYIFEAGADNPMAQPQASSGSCHR